MAHSKTVTICGSIAFFDAMLEARRTLEQAGYAVFLPPEEVPGENGEMIPVQEYYRIRKEVPGQGQWIWELKSAAMRTHFNKIARSDALLVLNYLKNEIAGYVGANTLLEMGLAFYLGKEIFLLHPIPEMSYKEEILGMQPVVLNGALTSLNIE